MSTLFEGALYAISVDERRGTLYIELRCATCDDVHRLMVWDDQLDAIRALAATLDTSYSRAALMQPSAAELHAAAADITPAIVAALVWQLTHATAHTEQRRREATKGESNVH